MRRSTAGTRARTPYDYGRFFNQWSDDRHRRHGRPRSQPPGHHHLEHRQRDSRRPTTPPSQNRSSRRSRPRTPRARSVRPLPRGAPAPRQLALEDVVGLNYAPYSLRLGTHSSNPTLEALRQRVVVRRPESRRLQDAGHNEHPVIQRQPVLVLRQQRGLLGDQRGRLVDQRQHAGASSPASSSGPASTTSASRRPTAGRPRARTSAPSTRRASRRTSSTSIRASGTPPGRPWSTSCRWTGRAGRPGSP